LVSDTERYGVARNVACVSTFLLVDGNSLTYRAFFALPSDMATASGQVTNAVFGFTSMLINVIKDQECDGMIVAFDRPEPTFRHEAEPEYKAQREAAPDILRQQMGLVREVLDALGIQQVEAAGWEADDLIATLSTKLVERGDDVLIVTGDRDSYQLVADPSRCSTTSAGSATTRSTTRPASPSGPASRPVCTHSTRRCAATAPTTCQACQVSARRRRPS
jgi:5'-3' exonuclease